MAIRARNTVAIGMGMVGSLCILAIHQCLFQEPLPRRGEYFISQTLFQNYTFLTEGVLLLFAGVVCSLTGANFILVGLSTIVVLPVVAVYEAEVYRGSHNLIPIEFVMHGLYALPPIAGAWLGSLVFKRRRRKSAGPAGKV